MPWKECRIVEERLRFIARLLDGEKMAGLCREFVRMARSPRELLREFCVFQLCTVMHCGELHATSALTTLL